MVFQHIISSVLNQKLHKTSTSKSMYTIALPLWLQQVNAEHMNILHLAIHLKYIPHGMLHYEALICF